MKKINVNQSDSDGIAIGKAFIVIKEEITPDNYQISKKDVKKEIDLYENARKKVVNNLQELAKTP